MKVNFDELLQQGTQLALDPSILGSSFEGPDPAKSTWLNSTLQTQDATPLTDRQSLREEERESARRIL
jgi:hypothetical protein